MYQKWWKLFPTSFGQSWTKSDKWQAQKKWSSEGFFGVFFSFPHPSSQRHQVNPLNIIGWTHLFKLYFNENFSQLYPALLDEGGNDGLVVADVLLVVLDNNGLPVHPQVLIAEDVVHSCSIPAEILIGFDIFFYTKILQNSYLDVVWLKTLLAFFGLLALANGQCCMGGTVCPAGCCPEADWYFDS